MPVTSAIKSETSSEALAPPVSNLSVLLSQVESSLSHWHPESLDAWQAKLYEITHIIEASSTLQFSSWKDVESVNLMIENLRWVGRFGYDWLHKPTLKRLSGRINETKSNLTLADLGL